MRIDLKVVQGLKRDVYLDTVRINEDNRGDLDRTLFYRVSHNKKSIYVALRGTTTKERVILLDDINRERLKVNLGEEYKFDIDPLTFGRQILPIWYASNPFTRLAGRLAVVGFGLAVLGGLQIAFDLTFRILSLLCGVK